LYMVSPLSPGAVFWTERGTFLYNTLVDFVRERQRGHFQEIKTPLLYNKALWEQSGHWGKYRENMFLVLNTESNDHDMSLKPMNCPSHYVLYNTKRHSYRELPLRYVTFDVLHRNELKAGDGAFYGPKIDFDVTDSLGRAWQLGTIQLDYNAPERFHLKYVGEDNAEHVPVVIHRAVSGSLERFIAILVEHFAGAFP